MSWDESTTSFSLNNNNVVINFKQVAMNLTADLFDKVFGKGKLRTWPWLWLRKRNQMQIHRSKYSTRCRRNDSKLLLLVTGTYGAFELKQFSNDAIWRLMQYLIFFILLTNFRKGCTKSCSHPVPYTPTLSHPLPPSPIHSHPFPPTLIHSHPLTYTPIHSHAFPTTPNPLYWTMQWLIIFFHACFFPFSF